MLDTTVASPVFSQIYRRLVRRVNPCSNLMLTTKDAASNIAFLSHNCMLSVIRNFSLGALKTRMTKHDAILIEKNEHPVLRAPSEFCTKSFMENRRKVGDNTIYDSKMWRSLYYYPSFGLYSQFDILSDVSRHQQRLSADRTLGSGCSNVALSQQTFALFGQVTTTLANSVRTFLSS